MTASELLVDLARRGVRLTVDGDELRCGAPRGVLTNSLLESIVGRKEELLNTLRGQMDAGPDGALPRLVPDPLARHEPFPLGDLQQAFLVGRRGDGYELGSVSPLGYVEVDIVALDWPRFLHAWQRLIARHEMLRSVVTADGTQRILPRVPAFEIELLDLRELAPDDRARRLEALRREMSAKVFRPAEWPLFAVRAARLDDEQTRVFTAIDLIVADSGSVHILSHDLAQLYAQPDLELPPFELSYRDYVLAKESLRGTPAHLRAIDYWRSRIPTLPPPPELPEADGEFTPRFVPLKARALEPTDWSAVKTRGAAFGLRPSSILLAAFAEVVAAWSRNERFTINAPFPNRLPLHPEVRGIVGNMTSVNLVAVEPSSESFAVRAQELQRQVWEELEHSRFFGGIDVLRELARAHGGKPPIMPIVFTSAFLHAGAFPMAELGDVVYDVAFTPQMAIEVRVVEAGDGGLDVTWNVMADRFPPRVLDAMLAGYCGWLRELAGDGGAWEAAGREALVPAAQRAVRTAGREASVAAPAAETLHGLVAAQVAGRPTGLAVVGGDGTRLDYATLAARAHGVARWLRAAGVAAGDRVAIVTEKGWEEVVAVLGVLEVGAAYVPVDAETPAARMARVLADAGVGVVLTQARVAARQSWPAPVRAQAVEAIAPAADGGGPMASDPTALAYVIYTSGSTGTPKGVMMTHAAVVNTIVDVNARFAVKPTDRVLGVSALSFDLSVWDIFGTLGAGGTLVVPTAAARREPSEWAALLAAEGITIWNSVPALLEMLVDYAGERASCLGPALRLALLSGDWIAVTLPGRVWALRPEVEVVSLGGATEAAIWSIHHRVTAGAAAARSIPYGRALGGQRVAVLNAALEERPDWVAGELYIAGAGLAQGYWGDAAKTAERFVVHPQTGERLYRTGDWGRYWPDGTIEFLGREDLQVKVHGYRIELGEIEAALGRQAAVRTAAVVAVGERTARRLVAYVVAREAGAAPSVEALREHLRGEVPEYMVPGVVEVVEALPLTGNGKVDRGALVARALAGRARDTTTCVAPRTPLETTLTALWAQILDVQDVGVHDNFFELGGDSARAAEVVARVRESCEIDLPLRSFLEAYTVARLATTIEVARRDGIAAAMTALKTVDLRAEAVLDPTIRPLASSTSSASLPPRHILLTGATGFLGRYVLAELLRQTDATLHCLVRATSAEDGVRRLLAALAEVPGVEAEWRERIIAVPSDLGRPDLGLTTAVTDALVERVDAVYHNAAVVNFTLPYAALRAANVRSTEALLRFASRRSGVALHYVSTIAVFPPAAPGVVAREDDESAPVDLFTGYAQSKWVAERLVRLAGERGVPVAVYRPGNIAGHSITGAWNDADFARGFIKGCVQLGCAPDFDVTWDLTPVDYVSAALVRLSLRPDAVGRRFHLVNPTPRPLGELIDVLATLGYPMRRVPYAAWRDALGEAARRDEDNVLVPLLELFSDDLPRRASLPRFDCRTTLASLEGSGIACPPVDETLLRTYLAALRDAGFLPTQAHAAVA